METKRLEDWFASRNNEPASWEEIADVMGYKNYTPIRHALYVLRILIGAEGGKLKLSVDPRGEPLPLVQADVYAPNNPIHGEKVWIDNPSPWHPMTDPVDLKHLGKLAEELGEAQAAVARCIIQGINEAEPSTKKPNRVWLEDELADVLAGITLVIERFKLDQDAMTLRSQKKYQHLKQWHEMA